MMNNTTPPLMVGMLNHRDVKSMAEEHISVQSGLTPFPPEITFLYNSLLTSKFVDKKQEMKNLAFITETRPSSQFQYLLRSLFGVRHRYIWSINPLSTTSFSKDQTASLDAFCDRIVDMWDNKEGIVYDLDGKKRKRLALDFGISGLHIANLIRWISMMDLDFFLRAISVDEASKLEYTEAMNSKQEHLWNQITGKDNYEFDQGILRIDTLTQRYEEISLTPQIMF